MTVRPAKLEPNMPPALQAKNRPLARGTPTGVAGAGWANRSPTQRLANHSPTRPSAPWAANAAGTEQPRASHEVRTGAATALPAANPPVTRPVTSPRRLGAAVTAAVSAET